MASAFDDARSIRSVGVPGKRFGQRVHRRHRAELERPLQQPRRHRVVHHERRGSRQGERGERLEVGDPQQRVGRRLCPEHGGARGERLANRGQVEQVNRRGRRPVRPQLRGKRPRVVVAVGGEHDPLPALRERQHQRHRRRLSRREADRDRARPLQRREPRLHIIPAGIAHPPVTAIGIRLPRRHVHAGRQQRRPDGCPLLPRGPAVNHPRLRGKPKIKFHHPIIPNGSVPPPSTPMTRRASRPPPVPMPPARSAGLHPSPRQHHGAPNLLH